MTLEAQLLQIIEQQQQAQESALERLEQQTLTITHLQSYNAKLAQQAQLLSVQNSELSNIIKKLQNPQLSETVLNTLERDLQQRLQSRLEKLVDGLQIDSQVKTLLAENLPQLVQQEIVTQIQPLALQILNEKDKIRDYQQNLSELIQTLSSKL